MIFQILPSYLAKSGLSAFSVDPIVVIASPLIALMRNQVSSLQRKNLKAGELGVDEDIKEGRTTFVYGSPEVLVGNSMWREVLKTPQYRRGLVAVAVDEVHVRRLIRGVALSA